MSNEIEDKMGDIANAVSETLERVLGDRKMIIVSVFHDLDSKQFVITTNYDDPATIQHMLQMALTRVGNQSEGSDDAVRH